VFKKETRVLYQRTRWVLRVFFISMIAFVAYSLIVKPGGADAAPFAYVGEHLGNLWFDFNWPRGEFFGISNFPIDWPYVAKTPSPTFTIPSIVSYIMLIVWVITAYVLFTRTLCFIARLNRAREKSNTVFERSLDDANFNDEENIEL
jgi:hypothetical protein